MTEKGQIKVQDLARRFNLSTSTLLGLLKELGYTLKSPMSPVNEEMVQAITRLMEERRKKYQRTLEKKKEIWGIQGDRRRGPRDRRLTKERFGKRSSEPSMERQRRSLHVGELVVLRGVPVEDNEQRVEFRRKGP